MKEDSKYIQLTYRFGIKKWIYSSAISCQHVSALTTQAHDRHLKQDSWPVVGKNQSSGKL